MPAGHTPYTFLPFEIPRREAGEGDQECGKALGWFDFMSRVPGKASLTRQPLNRNQRKLKEEFRM